MTDRLSLFLTGPCRWLRGAAAAASVAALSAGAAAPAAGEDIAIAVAGPMSGRYAAYGRQLRAGAELALEDINGRGGVLGRRVALREADDRCEAAHARPAAEFLARQAVKLVIGHFCAGASLAASAVYSDAGILHILPASGPGTPGRDNGGPLGLSLSDAGPDQGQTAARYLSQRAEGARIAILHDRTVYGRALAEALRDGLGGQARVVLLEAVRPAEKDYAALIARLKAAGATFVYFGGQPTEAALIARQMRRAALPAILFGGDTLADSTYWELAGPAGEGTLVTFTRHGGGLPRAALIGHRLEQRGEASGPYALRSYSAVQLWAAAAEDAGSAEPAAVAIRLTSGTWHTILGTVSFNPRGEGTLPLYSVHEWRQGRLVETE
jgi:branched-chain amino acid transport system substrate-binding protein